ncbi:hypothetical protein BXZ70DRAFT_555715 [Cristinia sonorae]|uniref:Uncharacterized protein n=1 Tax=Cristinia sonorae TaxID=1940300 RepID=A0A8K0UGR4_9AGAR|nr:hypothetical protein BXZ70DRAFT_555715 [Cristinia sonorae]
MVTTVTNEKPLRPRTILPYIFLQSLASGFSVIAISTLFREIKYEECKKHEPPHIPEIDTCSGRTLTYGVEISTFYGIMALSSFLAVGPLAVLVNIGTVKYVMAAAGLLNLCGDMWLYMCTWIPPHQCPSSLVMLAAVFKGLGNASVIAEAAQWNFIANAARPSRRSMSFSLALVTSWIGYRLSVGGASLYYKSPGPALIIGCVCWSVYAITAAWRLPDVPPPAGYQATPWTLGRYLRSTVEPFRMMFRDTAVSLLTVSYLFASVATVADDGLIHLAVTRFGEGSPELVHFVFGRPLLQGMIALIILPVAIHLHQRWRKEEGRIALPTDSQVLQDEPTDSLPPPAYDAQLKYAFEQDLWIVPLSFLVGACGFLLAAVNQSPTMVIALTFLRS